jgi:NADH:ubiquinone oxidoreductase subunit 6 (subunit J)
MKQLLWYLAWTFVSSLFLKSGIQVILDRNISYSGPLLISVFLQIGVIFPIVSSIGSLKNK